MEALLDGFKVGPSEIKFLSKTVQRNGKICFEPYAKGIISLATPQGLKEGEYIDH